MTRPVVVLASLALATSTLAQSKTEKELREGIQGTGKYGSAGCGLGSMAFGNQKGGIQIIAATINGILANQTFGITFGTSNCGQSLFARGTRDFVEANRDALAKDVARGAGEAIGALTVINRCASSLAVGSALQAHFGTVFPSEKATDEQVTAAILEVLSDPALGCGRG